MTNQEPVSRPLPKAEPPSAASGSSATIPCYRFELQRPGRGRALWMGARVGAGIGLLMAVLAYYHDPGSWAFNDGFGWLVALAVGIGLGTCGVLYLLARQPRPEPWLCLEANGLAWGWGQTRDGGVPYDELEAVLLHENPPRLSVHGIDPPSAAKRDDAETKPEPGSERVGQVGGALFAPPVPVEEIRDAIFARVRSQPDGPERVVALEEGATRTRQRLEKEHEHSRRVDRRWLAVFAVGAIGAFGVPLVLPALGDNGLWSLTCGVLLFVGAVGLSWTMSRWARNVLDPSHGRFFFASRSSGDGLPDEV